MKKLTQILAILIITSSSLLAGTVGTFADPALDATTPLFTVDGVSQTLSGGWPDSLSGLDLEIYGTTYNDAFFTMTDLTLFGSANFATTSSGTIKFFEDGTIDLTSEPLFQIDFNQAYAYIGGISADNAFSNQGVKFSGYALNGTSLTNEEFAFSFANRVSNPSVQGYSATAAFTSSAVPEPATMSIIGIGAAIAFMRRRK